MSPELANAPELMTTKEVAKFLRVSVETLADWRREGKLKSMRLNHRTVRISRSEVQRFLDECQEGAQ